MARKFKYVYMREPIDNWSGALAPDPDEEWRVLEQMGGSQRDNVAYKLMIPCSGDPELRPIYLCKRDNNGDVYIFADWDIKQAFKDLLF